jgi:hypothetical protein
MSKMTMQITLPIPADLPEEKRAELVEHFVGLPMTCGTQVVGHVIAAEWVDGNLVGDVSIPNPPLFADALRSRPSVHARRGER